METTTPPVATLPPPRRVRHVWTLLWWLIPVAIVLLVNGRGDDAAAGSATTLPITDLEDTAFVAFVFGKVDPDDPDAMHPDVLRAQLAELKRSGAQAVRLQDVRAFMQHREPLPARPVLIAFDEARRVTLEAVHPILEELQIPAVAFVSVDGIEQRNIDLVSRRRLGALARGGLWDLAVGACRQASGETAAAAPVAVQTYLRDGATLEDIAGRPALAIGCLRGLGDAADARERWSETLERAWLPLGFVAAPPGANYHDDPPSTMRMIRIDAQSARADTLVRHRAAYAPRLEHFVDDFDTGELAGAWVAAADHTRLDDGALHMSATAHDPHGWATLRWTERWQDARIDVDLASPPSGQFWIYARRTGPASFLRLGLVDRRAVLQISGTDGQTRQLAARDIGDGPLRLSLRIIGSRALAFVDDRPLHERPQEVPANIVHGPIALAVWNPDADAHAVIQRVEVNPLPRRAVLIAAAPGDAALARLRRESDGLWAASPELFRWRAGRGTQIAQTSRPLEIQVHHQRLALLPAVSVDALPRGSAWDGFRDAVLRWAGEPQFAGLNLVVDHVDAPDVARIEALQQELAGVGRHLAVTVRDGAPIDTRRSRELAWFTRPEDMRTSYLIVSAAPTQPEPG